MMQQGYGQRIYKKQKSPVPVITALAVIFLLAGLIMITSKKRENPPTPDAAPSVTERVDEPAGVDPGNDPESKPDLLPAASPPEVTTGSPSAQDYDQYGTGFNQRNLLADSYVRERRYDKALPIYQDMARTDQRFSYHVGICYYNLDDYPNALTAFKAMDGFKNNHFFTKKYLALTYYRLDDLENSRLFAEQALKIKKDPELDSLLNKLDRELKAMDRYAEIKTPKFKVIFSKMEHGDIKRLILDILRDAYKEIGNQIQVYPDQPISVILYNEKNFFDVTRSPGWAGGLYDGKIRLPINNLQGQESILRRILFHEYTHALVRFITPSCPVWLNEGLAEYFSLGRAKTIGQVIPLVMMENAFPSRPVNAVAVAYRESYSAVSYLVEKYGLYRVKELLQALGENKSIVQAFDSVFYTAYDRFLEEWGRE